MDVEFYITKQLDSVINNMNFLKRKMMVFLAIISLLINASFVTYPSHFFMAYVVQDGVRLPIDEHVVKVKRAPFKIVVDLPNKQGVFVNLSYNKATFNRALRNDELINLPGFEETAIYEMWNNLDKNLLLAEKQPMYWFTESKSKSRFSNYEIINDRYICEREVNHIYDIDDHVRKELSAMNDPVYLTFLKFNELGDNYRYKEVMRHEFKIEWED